MEVGFDERNRMRRLLAHNGTQLDRDIPGKASQSSTSQELVADFDMKGQWATVDQSGNVWVAGDGTSTNPSNFVTEIVGGGVPIYQPYAVGLTNGRFQAIP